MTGFTQIALIYSLANSRVTSSGMICYSLHLAYSILDASTQGSQGEPPSKNYPADEEALLAEITRFQLKDMVKPHQRNKLASTPKADESQNDDGGSSSSKLSFNGASKQALIDFDLSASFSSMNGFTPITLIDTLARSRVNSSGIIYADPRLHVAISIL